MTREELRQRAKAEDIRNHYTFKKSKGHNMYCCPICHSGEGDHRTGALQINEDGTRITCHKENCFSSQGEDTLGALKILLGTDENGVFEYMKLSKDDTAARPAQAVDVALAQTRKAQAAEESADYSTFFLQAHANICDTNYPQRRGLTSKTLERFNIGYMEAWRHPNAPTSVPATPRLIIPTGKGSYLARDVRETVPENQRPYTKSKCGKVQIFNAEALHTADVYKSVYVVEGEIDAMSLEEVDCAALALGSISNTDKLFSVVDRGVSDGMIDPTKLRLLIALDNENSEAVEKAVQKIEKGCQARRIDVQRSNPHAGYKDPNEALVANRAAFAKAAQAIAEGSKRPNSLIEYLEHGFADEIDSFQRGAVYKTGFSNLDAIIGNVYPGLYVLGAISSLGKTTFSLQVADQIAEQGHDVLFFSLEQSKLELVSKLISREMAIYDRHTAVTALQIRKGFGNNLQTDDAIAAAVGRKADKSGYHMNIIEGTFDTTMKAIENEVCHHVNTTGRKPVVFVDYLQVLRNPDAEVKGAADMRRITDANITALKMLSRNFNIPVFAISSINRSNYLSPIDFESFKESGCIEYSADVVWGLQLRVLNDETFDKEGNVKQKREKVRMAKAEIPRQVELVCLKNRFGAASFTCEFSYDPRYDLYEIANTHSDAPRKVFRV